MLSGAKFGAVGAAAFAIGLAAALPAQAGDDVLVGAATATSGWMAPYDEGPVAAARLAIDEINSGGGLLGRHIALQQVDTKTDRAQGARAGTELIGRGAAFLIVSCDFDMGGPPALVANQAKIIAFSPCGADIKLGNKAIGPYVFTMATDAEASGALVADWSYRKQNWKSAYILVDTIIEYNKSVCRGFDKKWTALAGESGIVGRDSYKNDDPSIAAQITRLKNAPHAPDVIALCGVTPGFPAAIRQLRSAGVNTPIVGGVSMDGDAWHDALPKEQLTNVFYASYSSARGDDPRPEVQEFVAKYKAAHNGEPPATGQAVLGHSVVVAWARAVQRAGTFASDPVLKQLETFKDEPLLAGLTTFTPDLHTNFVRPMLIFGFTEGKATPFGYYDPRVGDYVTWWKK
jgi:branched-chain amino acid transport system substrate-binding protein